MRTKERWEKSVRFGYMSEYFTPRIVKDLVTLPEPTVNTEDSWFIYGPVSSGKTILAAFLMLKEQEKIWLAGGPSEDQKCYFVALTDMFEDIKSSFNSDSQKAVLDFYKNMHLLVIDDFGTIKPSDWALNILYSIINHRYEQEKRTIITSNLSLAEIAKVLGDDRITARIERMGLIVKKKSINE